LTDTIDTPVSVDDGPTKIESAEVESTEELNPKKSAEAAKPETAEDSGADDGDDESEGEDGEDEKSKAKARRERARRARDRQIAENATLKERLRVLEEDRQSRQAPAAAAPSGPPKESDFTDYFEYQRALARYEIRKELQPEIEKAAQSAREIREEESRQAKLSAHEKRVAEFAKNVPDFREVAEEAESIAVRQDIMPVLQQLVTESDIGPQLIYHLGKNPEIVDRLNRMDAVSVARELGRLEAKLTPQKARTTSNAPDPIKPVKAGVSPLRATPESAKDMDAYIAARKAQGFKSKR
jgi:hypothetical protein